MQVRLLAILLFMVFVSFNAQQKDDTFRMPAEWEQHQAVWVGVFNAPGRNLVAAAIVRSIYKHVQVRLNYSADSTKRKFNRLLDSLKIDTSKVTWVKDSIAFNWSRDPGPIFLINKNGEQKVVDFGWNDYGNCFVYDQRLKKADSITGRIDKRMAALLKLPIISSPIVAEGGGLETNGAGVLMSIEETALQRNPRKTLKEIEAEYLRVTHCKKMIWLKRMTLQEKTVKGLHIENWKSSGANGHIDEVARFVAPNTIALAQIDKLEKDKNPISKVDYDILEECYAILKKATDVNGKPFTIIRIPSPDLNANAVSYIVNKEIRKGFSEEIKTLKDGDTLKYVPAVSYMNFMTTNGVVLIARYWNEGMPPKEKEKDEKVKKIFEQLYPDRKIIQINPTNINRIGGGIHCATRQQPGIFRYY